MSNIIWINGATTPSGELLAQHYSANGHKIIISAESRDELYAVKLKCKGNPMNIHIVLIDRNKPEGMLDRTKETLRIFGWIDTLILCGESRLEKPASETTQEEGLAVMTANFWSWVALTKAVLPIMKRQERGQIVIFNPVEGKVGLSNESAFSASRHALYGYIDSLRAEQTLPIHITMVLGDLEESNNSVEKFMKDLSKNPEEIALISTTSFRPKRKNLFGR